LLIQTTTSAVVSVEALPVNPVFQIVGRQFAQGSPKNLAHLFSMPYNFIKCWSIFKLCFTVGIRKKFVTIVSLKTHHTSNVSLNYFVKCQCLEATIVNDYCNNTFWEINNRKQRVYCLNYYLK